MKVELQNISKYFGPVQANNHISLTIEPNTIHGLVGENGAGKTTLVSILAGHLKKDSGNILIDGEALTFSAPRDAAARGIGMLNQNIMDVPVFSALENFMLGQSRGLAFRKSRLKQAFSQTADDLGFSLHPEDKTDAMTPGTRQQLDIVKLLSSGTRLLILDEPTTGLSQVQKNTLFKALRRFVAEGGNSVVLVSHKISDIRQLCDQMTVLRQGSVSGSLARPFNTDQTLRLMFGTRSVEMKPKPRTHGKVVFTASGIAATGGRAGISEIDLSICQGEIIGLAGIEGSGQGLFLQTAAGLAMSSAGMLTLHEEDITGNGYHALKKKGVGYIPADRLNHGLAPDLSIADHFVVASGTPLWATASKDIQTRADKAIASFQIKGTKETPVRALSGGNQQRLLLALLPKTSKVLFLDKPTRGLDAESVSMVWSKLHLFCNDGGAIFFSSPDLDELLAMADRIAVFFNGRIILNLHVSELNVTALGKAITGNQ